MAGVDHYGSVRKEISMHRLVLALLLALSIGSAGIARPLSEVQAVSTRPFDESRIAAHVDAIASTHVPSNASPGISVAVAHKGQILVSKAYGMADVELLVPATRDTVYRIGSLSKQMTAALVMRLAEAEKLSLDDPITNFLPDYPVQGHTVTIRHLLNHTSGIAAMRPHPDDVNPGERLKMNLSEQQLLELFASAPFDFSPGEKHKYNNSAYMLLGFIISRITETPFPTFVERELFRPLGLTRTYYCDSQRIIPGRAAGYEMKDGQLVNARYLSMNVPGGAGAFCSTVEDLARWTHLLHTAAVVSPSSFEQMTARTRLANGQTVGYGFGLDLDFRNGREAVVHGGSISGFKSVLAHYVADELTIAVLANSEELDAKAIETGIARAIFGIELRDLPLTPEAAALYSGTYTMQLPNGARTATIRSEDGVLFFHPGQGREARLRYQGDQLFVTEVDPDIRLRFVVEGSEVKGIVLQAGPRRFEGSKDRAAE
jgi:D-alanyl-D-alanine carboxypeptidase